MVLADCSKRSHELEVIEAPHLLTSSEWRAILGKLLRQDFRATLRPNRVSSATHLLQGLVKGNGCLLNVCRDLSTLSLEEVKGNRAIAKLRLNAPMKCGLGRPLRRLSYKAHQMKKAFPLSITFKIRNEAVLSLCPRTVGPLSPAFSTCVSDHLPTGDCL